VQDPLPLISIAALFTTTTIRVLVQRARTGDTGLRFGGNGPKGTAVQIWLFGHALVGGAGCALHASGQLAPLVDVDGVARAAALAVSIAGSLLTLACQLAMGSSWRIGQNAAERTSLVTSGPYSIVRNPIYTCVVLACAPTVILASNALTIEAVVALVVGVEFLVRGVEEPHLINVHGDAYRAYARRVGRFVPFLGRMG
jgi:protein-S-isoprenylcysteine O-methyltransferase Ste14